jgi:hypothetical protein
MRNDAISDEEFRGFPRDSLCEKKRFRNKKDQKKNIANKAFNEIKAHNDIIKHLMKLKHIMIESTVRRLRT